MAEEEREEGGRKSAVGDTMHHAVKELAGGLFPGGKGSNDDEVVEE